MELYNRIIELIDSHCKRLVSFSKGKWVLDAIEHQRGQSGNREASESLDKLIE